MGKRSAVVELFLGDMGSMQRELRPSIQTEDQLTMETKLEQIAVKAVNQLPKSVVREIRTPRSVGAGGGRPPPATRSQGAPSQPEAQTPPDQSSTVIRSIQVVDVKQLKPEVRSKVDDIVKHTSEKDMQSLRALIDATPEAASALKAKGLSSSHVVAINIADGVLTLFAKTA